MDMRKLMTLLMIFALLVSMSTVLVGCDEEEEATATPEPTATAEPTITLSYLNWGSAQFGSEVAKIIIEEGYGYPVEFQSGETILLFQGTRNGNVDVFLEGWMENQQEAYDEAIAAGDIELLSIMNNDNWQSQFVVPTYVIEGDSARGIDPMAPDLTSVTQLSEAQYVELFADPEDPGKGGIVNCVPGWECADINVAQLAAYGLDDEYNHISPGSQESLFASLQGAYDDGDPWLGYMWGPTWIAGALDLTRLEEPDHDAAVWEADNGCAYPSNKLFVAAHKDFRDKAPELAEMFENWQMNTATLDSALAYMNATEGQPADAAVWFLQNLDMEEIWTAFVPADVAQKVKDAVAAM
jgi:glycine betaine/proline transport system substrate-binding protein